MKNKTQQPLQETTLPFTSNYVEANVVWWTNRNNPKKAKACCFNSLKAIFIIIILFNCPMKHKIIPYGYAMVAVFFWSTVATAFKIALIGLDVFALVLCSSITSLLVLFAYLLIKKEGKTFFKQSIAEHKKSMILGLINPFIYYLALFKAYELLPAQLAQPLNMVWPIVLTFVSAWLLKQKLTKRNLISFFICLAGVVLISSKGKLNFSSDVNKLGIILALSCSLIWAIYWIMNLRDRRSDPVKLTLNFFYSCIYALVIFLLFSKTKINYSHSLLAAIYSGFFEMSISFLFWLKALRDSSNAGSISILVYIAPVVSLVFIYRFLHEEIYSTTIVGIIFIICGIIFDKWFSIFVKK